MGANDDIEIPPAPQTVATEILSPEARMVYEVLGNIGADVVQYVLAHPEVQNDVNAAVDFIMSFGSIADIRVQMDIAAADTNAQTEEGIGAMDEDERDGADSSADYYPRLFSDGDKLYIIEEPSSSNDASASSIQNDEELVLACYTVSVSNGNDESMSEVEVDACERIVLPSPRSRGSIVSKDFLRNCSHAINGSKLHVQLPGRKGVSYTWDLQNRAWEFWKQPKSSCVWADLPDPGLITIKPDAEGGPILRS